MLLGAGVDVVGIGVDIVGVVVDETIVRKIAAASDRGGFSPLGGGYFITPFTIGRSNHLGTGTSKVSCGVYGCEICNDNKRMMIKMKSFERTLNTAMSKRGVILSSRVVSPYTSICDKEGEDKFSKALMSVKKRATTTTKEQQTPAVREEQQAAAAIEEQQPTNGTEEQQLLG